MYSLMRSMSLRSLLVEQLPVLLRSLAKRTAEPQA